MIGIRADLFDPEDPHVTNEEMRPRVEGAARLEERELEREPGRQRDGVDGRVDVQRRHRPDPAQHLANDRVQAVAERIDVRRPYREAGSHRVATMLDQQVVAPVQGLRDVDRGDAPARAFALIAVDRDDDRRPAAILDEPRCRKADDARLPLGRRDHRHPAVGVRLGCRPRAAHDVVGEPLTLQVPLLERVGQSLRLRLLLGEQEAQGVLGIVDAPRGVEARTQTEADIRRVDPAELEPGPIGERAHADERCRVQGDESRGHDRPVRIAKGHNVGHRRKRTELEELVLLHCVGEIAEERLREPEGDAGAGELLVERHVAGPARVHQGIRVG